LTIGSSLLVSLKQKVVELASNSGVLETIQKPAQSCLQAGWSVLLPTAEERARALSTLIGSKIFNFLSFIIFIDFNRIVQKKGGADRSPTTCGRRFMTELLVSSLMVDGGLQTALVAAIKVEMLDLDEGSCEKESEQDKPVR